MNADRRDGPFEVPLERLAGGRGQGRRAALVAISIVAVLGGAIGLARLADGQRGRDLAAVAERVSGAHRGSARPRLPRPRRRRGHPASRGSSASSTSRTIRSRGRPSSSSCSSTTSTPASSAGRPAPGPARSGRSTRRSPRAPSPSPSRRRTAISSSRSTSPTWPARCRVGRASSTPPATSSGRAPTSPRHRVALWSDDGRLARRRPAPGGRWHLVSIDRAGRATDRVVDLPGEIYLPVADPDRVDHDPAAPARGAPARLLGRRRLGLRRPRLARARDLRRRRSGSRSTGPRWSASSISASGDPTASSRARAPLGGVGRSGDRPGGELAGEPRHHRRTAEPRRSARQTRASPSRSSARRRSASAGAADGDLIRVDGRPSARARRPSRSSGSTGPAGRAHRSCGAGRSRAGSSSASATHGRPSRCTPRGRPCAQQLVVVDLADPGRISATPVSFGRPDGILLSAGLLPPAMR